MPPSIITGMFGHASTIPFKTVIADTAPYRRHRSIKLPPTVIGHDDAVRPEVNGDHGVLAMQDAFDHEMSVPNPAKVGEMLPCEKSTVSKAAFDVGCYDRDAPRRVIVFEMGDPIVQDRPDERADQPARMREAVEHQTKAGPQRR